MEIKAKANQYIKNGNPVFVYTLEGTEQELKDYKKVQGENYRENEKKEPLYFSQRICSVGQELHKNFKGDRYQVHQDLEEVVVTRDMFKNKQIAKLGAMQEFFGYSKTELAAKLFGEDD